MIFYNLFIFNSAAEQLDIIAFGEMNLNDVDHEEFDQAAGQHIEREAAKQVNQVVQKDLRDLRVK